jgi:hypothetical protein
MMPEHVHDCGYRVDYDTKTTFSNTKSVENKASVAAEEDDDSDPDFY